jgi:UDP-N-acetylglucosamine--N-acetylmuramyl-(pentapeptide) pyrophosphoryl-undecaprenol N-acetylglucosamine transferase
MKIVVTAGGGGHFSPALSVMKQLKKDDSVLFVGRKYAFEGDKTISFEYRTVQELGIPFKTITTGRLMRTLSPATLLSLGKIPYGFLQSLSILRRFRPDVVFSTGGYIALPVTVAAFFLHIPVIIHEQTMRAGLANKIAGKFAHTICLSWESSRAYFPKNRVVITGNPLREEFLSEKKAQKYFAEELPMLFITGGSLGSHAVNVLIEDILPELLEKYTVIHQTGDAQEHKDYERLEKQKDALPEKLKQRYLLKKFIAPDDVAGILRQAALVIARAGMNTIIELMYFHKPALLIPLPYGQKNEQAENAALLKHLGLALVKNQKDLSAETLYTEIDHMMAELPSYRLKEAMPSVIQKDAAEKIITAILSVAEKLPEKTHEEAKR